MSPVKPGSAAWKKRVDAVLAEEEQTGDLQWWWLSFSDAKRPVGDQFLGVAIVQAKGLATAMVEATRLGINPGGQIAGYQIPADQIWKVNGTDRNRLLTREEAEAYT